VGLVGLYVVVASAPPVGPSMGTVSSRDSVSEDIVTRLVLSTGSWILLDHLKKSVPGLGDSPRVVVLGSAVAEL
jgi:hypothetical protein